MCKGQTASTTKLKNGGGLRIVLLASENTIDDYSIFLPNLLDGLADESASVALVCPCGCKLDSVIPAKVEVIRHPVFRLPLTGRLNRNLLAEKIAGFETSVLHCFCQSQVEITKHLAKQLNLPYVLTVDSLRKEYGRLSVSVERLAKIFVLTESIASDLVKWYPKLAGQIKQIHVATTAAESINCFSEPEHLASIVVSHRFDHLSDFANLLEAIRHLVIDGYEFMVVLTGGGKEERKLRRELESLGLSQIVIIVPKLQQRPSSVAAGDIFIQPVAEDHFNPMLLEAMGAGLAVAGCKGGVDDLMIEDQTSVLFDPNDSLSIYNSLRRLLDAREYARKIASGAQDYVRKNHRYSKMLEDMLDVYREAEN